MVTLKDLVIEFRVTKWNEFKQKADTALNNIAKGEQSNMYAVAYYEPQDDITTNELASLIKLLMMCGHCGSNLDAKVDFFSSEAYNKFVGMFHNILRHFRIEFTDDKSN